MAHHLKCVSILCGAAGLLAFAGAGLLTEAPASAASPNLYVAAGGTDSGNTCRLHSHPCGTISHALTQAPSGSTINVGAGTFTQPLQITQSVNIIGTVQNGANATIIRPNATVSDTDAQNFEGLTTDSVLVDVTSGATANLTNLVINGGKEGPTFTTCGTPNFVGLYYHNASGTVTNVTVTKVQLPTADFGCQSGDAVYVTTDAGSSTPSSVAFVHDTVTLYDKNGITCRYANTACTVTDSVIQGIGPTGLIGQNGIEIAFGGPSALITDNTITGNSYTGQTGQSPAGNSASGILVFDAASTTVSGNTLSGNDVNISASADGSAVRGGWDISGNTAGGATDNLGSSVGGPMEGNQYGDGIQLYGVNGDTNVTTVSNNTTNGNYEYGISLFGTAHVTVSNNQTNSNYTGIYVDSASGANTFTGNVAKHNLAYDYQDTSTGGGDSGTADAWVPTTTRGPANTCKPPLDSAPEGLC